MIKTLSRLEIEGYFLNLIKNIYKNLQLIVNDDKLYAFLSKIGNKAGISPLSLLFSIVIGSPATVVRQINN